MSKPLLTTSFERIGHHIVVRLSGEVDLNSASTMDKALLDAVAVDPSPTALIVDLTGVDFFGSAGLSRLVALYQDQDTAIPLIVVVPPMGAVRRAIQTIGLDHLLTLTEDVDLARRLAGSSG